MFAIAVRSVGDPANAAALLLPHFGLRAAEVVRRPPSGEMTLSLLKAGAGDLCQGPFVITNELPPNEWTPPAPFLSSSFFLTH